MRNRLSGFILAIVCLPLVIWLFSGEVRSCNGGDRNDATPAGGSSVIDSPVNPSRSAYRVSTESPTVLPARKASAAPTGI